MKRTINKLNVTQLYGTNKENCSAKPQLLSAEENENQIVLNYAVLCTYNYADTPETQTTVKEGVRVVYNKDAGCITDLYTPRNYYDRSIRENSAMCVDPAHTDKNQDFKITDRILSNQHEIREAILDTFEKESVEESVDIILSNSRN